MRIRIRLFARQREIAGAREVAVEIPSGSTIEDAWAALADLHPALADGRPYVRFARNGEYAAAEEPLHDGDEVACIPPVSGGRRTASSRPARTASSSLPRRPSRPAWAMLSPSAWPPPPTGRW